VKSLHDALREACDRAGVVYKEVPADGRFHPVDIADDPHGKGDGRVKLFPDGEGGIVWNWKAGDDPIPFFIDDGRKLTDSERRERDRRREEAVRAARAEDQRRRAEAAEQAAAIWAVATPAGADHPYLTKKGVKPYGIRVHDGRLIVPVMIDGVLSSLQYISNDGGKLFLRGGAKSRGFHLIGEARTDGVICIAEGYATAASIHEATGYPVAVAFDAGNLEPAAVSLRKAYPTATLIVCGDDDHVTPGNPGRTKAMAAAKSAGGVAVFPEFGADRPAKASDFNDMAAVKGMAAVRELIEAGKAKPRTVPGVDCENSKISEWGEPLPLCPRMVSEPYPLDALPAAVRAAVSEVQGWVKAPLAMVAGSALGALSVAIQGHIDVKRATGLDGPTSLFLMTFGDSGERKSTCDKAFMRSIRAYERAQAEKAKPKIDAYRAEMAIWEVKRNAALEAVKKAQGAGKPTLSAESAVRDLEANQPEKPKVPKLIYGDATQEGLAHDLSTLWPSAGVISAEAGLVLGSHGMNKDNIMRYLSSFNIFWDGGEIPITRRREGASYTARGVRLTMSLQVQEATIREFLEKSGALARGSGFLARFLLAWPESTQGERLFTEPPENLPRVSAFHARVAELLEAELPMDDEGRLEPLIIGFSQDAKALWVKFHDAVEVQLRGGGKLYDVRDVASKIADNAARIAALFHVFERGPSGAISLEALTGAVRVATWHLNESRRFFGEIAMPVELSTAARLERWIVKDCRRERTDRITTSRVQQFGPGDLRSREKIEAAVKELQEHGRAQLIRDGHRKYIVLNPAVLAGEVDA